MVSTTLSSLKPVGASFPHVVVINIMVWGAEKAGSLRLRRVGMTGLAGRAVDP